jgi:hypothetical protein
MFVSGKSLAEVQYEVFDVVFLRNRAAVASVVTCLRKLLSDAVRLELVGRVIG